MRIQLALWATVACFAAMGCSCSSSSDVEEAALELKREDEVLRGEGYMVVADRRVFAVMAFINAAGYDDQPEGQPMHPVRIKVRDAVATNLESHPDRLEAWRAYYRSRKLGPFVYLDYALSLSADYPFKRIRPNDELGYRFTASRLREFPDHLNAFWETAKLDEIWAEVKPDYLAELNQYDLEKTERQMAFVWDYLRMKRSDSWTVVSVPNLLDQHFHAIGATYETYRYNVEGPGAISHALNIHEYLHSVVNPIVEANYGRFKGKLKAYQRAGRDGALSETYRRLETFTWECLVRAVDRRIRVKMADDADLARRTEEWIDHVTAEGLTLTRPFYDLLADFEAGELSFEQFVPVLFERLPAYGR